MAEPSVVAKFTLTGPAACPRFTTVMLAKRPDSETVYLVGSNSTVTVTGISKNQSKEHSSLTAPWIENLI